MYVFFSKLARVELFFLIRMYEVTYVDDCQQVTQTQCRLFQNFLCDEVSKTKCTKVPKFASEKCRQVPRLAEVCREVPVRRPAGRCRAQCGGRGSASGGCGGCREVTTLTPVQKNKQICDTTPVKTCRTEKVKRLKLIPKKICTELKPTEEPKEP